MSPPPVIVPTTQAAFIFEQKPSFIVPATFQNYGAKSQKQPKGKTIQQN